MVSVEGNRSNNHHTTSSVYSFSPSPSSKIWRDHARSMRTVRSSFFPPSPPPTNEDPTNTTFSFSNINLSDSAIDIHLTDLASRTTKKQPFSQHELLSLSSSSFSDYDNNDGSNCFSNSHSFCSSDISGELHRLANQNPEVDEPAKLEEPEPWNSFSTEIIDSISPEDLEPTVKMLITSLSSPSMAVQRAAAGKLRLLAKNREDNRVLIGDSGAIPVLVKLLKCADPLTQEHAVTAVLNLSLLEENKGRVLEDKCAVKGLIYVLKTGTETSKQNSAAALMSLAMYGEETKMSIGACGAIPPLVGLLMGGSVRGKKDALTTLYKLCSVRGNKERAVRAGVVGVLVGLIGEKGMVGVAEKAMVVVSILAAVESGRVAIVEEGGIAALVEVVEDGSSKGKEFAVVTLLQLCAESVRNRGLLVAEGGIPPLVALSQSGTARAKHKAETLLGYLREPRHQEASSSTP